VQLFYRLPQTYRYENDNKSEITLVINNDCSSISSKDGFPPIHKNQQTFRIRKKTESLNELQSELAFPAWLQGKWQFLDVETGRLVYRDQSSFKSYRMSLVNQLSDEKFIVRSRSQCGEESFKCLWIRKLDENILEFQVGSKSETKLTNYELCNDSEHFDNSRWLTQSRKLRKFSQISRTLTNRFVLEGWASTSRNLVRSAGSTSVGCRTTWSCAQ
jgi:hypothetical protein